MHTSSARHYAPVMLISLSRNHMSFTCMYTYIHTKAHQDTVDVLYSYASPATTLPSMVSQTAETLP